MSATWNIFTEKDRWNGKTVLRGWVSVFLIGCAIVATVSVCIFGIAKIVRSAGAASCRGFAVQSGYNSDYKIMHFLDAGTCFVQLPNGHSLPENMVIGYIKADK